RRAPHESADAEEAPPLAAEGTPIDELVHARRVSAEVEVALAALPERQRAALWLAAVEGQSYAEVAAAIGTSEKAVKALVHRARDPLGAVGRRSGRCGGRGGARALLRVVAPGSARLRVARGSRGGDRPRHGRGPRRDREPRGARGDGRARGGPRMMKRRAAA